jgi:hypothetical protein
MQESGQPEPHARAALLPGTSPLNSRLGGPQSRFVLVLFSNRMRRWVHVFFWKFMQRNPINTVWTAARSVCEILQGLTHRSPAFFADDTDMHLLFLKENSYCFSVVHQRFAWSFRAVPWQATQATTQPRLGFKFRLVHVGSVVDRV